MTLDGKEHVSQVRSVASELVMTMQSINDVRWEETAREIKAYLRRRHPEVKDWPVDWRFQS